METLKIKSELLQKLRCPCCMSKLRLSSDSLTCSNQQCGVAFPVVNGVCILINESDSLFSINDIIGQQNNKGKSLRKSQRVLYMQKAKKILPQLGRNLKAEKIYAKFSDILHQQKERPQVLIIGCGREKGEGLQNIQDDSSIYFVDTDITIHDRNCLVCDAHVIPFADQTFDGVIIQAVLEHVVNPFRCVEEIWRVLKKNGIIYSDTPFMQQVHEGRYDFTRFTHLGHRFLFRKFEEIERIQKALKVVNSGNNVVNSMNVRNAENL